MDWLKEITNISNNFISNNLDSKYLEVLFSISIFFIFLLLRKFFVNFIFNFILRLTKQTKTNLDNYILNAFEKPIKTFLIIIGLFFALSVLSKTNYYDLLLFKALRVSFILFLTWGFYNIAGTLISEDLAEKFGIELDKILVPIVSKTTKFIIIALSVSIVAQEFGYEITGVVAGLGLGGLAVALAAQDALSNIFGGIVIITDKPFTIGDWIETPSLEGTVEDITFRSTKIRSFADALITIPNAQLADQPITNWTRMNRRRITFNLRVSYSTPLDKLQRCVTRIKNLLTEHPEIHKQTIFVSFDKFGESSLDIFLYFFTRTTIWGEYLKIKEEINYKIMRILQEEEVSIAFPSRSIYVESNN